MRKLPDFYKISSAGEAPDVQDLVEVYSAACQFESPRATDLSEFACIKHARLVEPAIQVLVTLGLIRPLAGVAYRAKHKGQITDKNLSDAKTAIRDAIVAYPPLKNLFERLGIDRSSDLAIARTRQKLGYVVSTFDASMSYFIDLAIVFELLQRSTDGSLILAPEISVDEQDAMFLQPLGDTTSRIKAELSLARHFGEVLHDRVDAHDLEHLIESLLIYRTAPDRAIERAGNAMENFLREIAERQGYGEEAKRKSGAGQLAEMLRERKVILPPHVNLVLRTAVVRNASAHDKDRVSMEPWEMTPLGTLAAVTTAIVAIRSIAAYEIDGQQIM